MSLVSLPAALRKGVPMGGFTLYASKVSRGRFCEERNIDVRISKGGHDCHLLFAKVFFGRPPEYGPWAELFGMNADIRLGRSRIKYFGSKVELGVLALFSRYMGPGQLFVEYNDDEETKDGLRRGFPAPVTRLGSILLSLGYTWFKDWYFPEGYMEGGMKLQGEKCAGARVRRAKMLKIGQDATEFLHGLSPGGGRDALARRAVSRARDLGRMAMK